MAKAISSGQEAILKIREGVRKVNDIVKSTLGPHGRNALLDRGYKGVIVTNDGVSIAKDIELEDEIENMGARALIEAAKRTNEDAGDGTSTSTVIAASLIEQGFNRLEEESNLIGEKSNVIQMSREIREWKDIVIGKLKESARPVKTLEDLEQAATSAVEDSELGKKIAEVVDKVGIDGYVSVEDSMGDEMEISFIEGMKFMGMYASPTLCNTPRKEAIYDEVPVLVITTGTPDREFNGLAEMSRLAEDILNIRKTNRCVIVAERFSKDVITTAVINYVNNKFGFLLIKVPALTSEEIEDIAIFTGAKLIDTYKGMKWNSISLDKLGSARRVVTTSDDTTIVGGGGAKDDIDKRINDIKAKIEIEKVDPLKKKMERRIGSIASGVGVIRVGAKSTQEATYKRHKIEDAVHATKCAMEEGVVKGGGLALKDIAESLIDMPPMIREALLAPFNQIQENAGRSIDIPDSVIDPAKVTRIALENACSVAGSLLTTASVITTKREDAFKDLAKALQANKEE